MSTLSDNILRLRKASGMSRKAFAEKLHLTTTAVGYYETGRSEPKSDTLMRIADILAVSVDTLLGHTPIGTKEYQDNYTKYRDRLLSLGAGFSVSEEGTAVMVAGKVKEQELTWEFESKAVFCDFVHTIMLKTWEESKELAAINAQYYFSLLFIRSILGKEITRRKRDGEKDITAEDFINFLVNTGTFEHKELKKFQAVFAGKSAQNKNAHGKDTEDARPDKSKDS